MSKRNFDTKFSPSAQQKLVGRLKSGSSSAVAQWFADFEPRVRAYIAGKITNGADVDDIVQTVFINSLRQLPLFRGDSQLLTWMLSIARHEVADFYRKQYAKRALKSVPLFEQLLPESSLHTDELSRFISAQTHELVGEVLSSMKEGSAQVLRLKYLEKKSVKNIAALLGKSVKSIESELFRARDEFRTLWIHAVKKSYV